MREIEGLTKISLSILNIRKDEISDLIVFRLSILATFKDVFLTSLVNQKLSTKVCAINTQNINTKFLTFLFFILNQLE